MFSFTDKTGMSPDASIRTSPSYLPSKKSAEILKKFSLSQFKQEVAPEGSSAPDTDATDDVPAAAPPKGLGRIVYAINLAGEVRDSAILKRQ